MVLPVGTGEFQRMMRITKLENGALKEEVFDQFSLYLCWKGKNNLRCYIFIFIFFRELGG